MSNLVTVQKIVYQNGKPELQTFQVPQQEAEKYGTIRTFQNKAEFKDFCKKLSTEQRQEVMDYAEQSGIHFPKTSAWKTTWMQCAMAIGKHLNNGETFSLPAFKSGVDKVAAQPKQSAGVEGSFKTRDEFKDFCKKLTTEQRLFIMEDAVKQGITWDRSSLKVDWMRCAMAIGKRLESGSGYSISGKTLTTTEITKPVESKSSAPKIEQLYQKLGLKTATVDGAFVVGEGVKTTINSWGKEDIASGHIRLVDITPKSEFGPGNWVKLDSNFGDKEKIKEFNARFDTPEKKWYVPFKEVINVTSAFRNFEIAAKIAPTVKAVMEKISNIDKLVKDLIQGLKPIERIKNNEDIDISDFKMPKGMNPLLSLYDHQKKGVRFIIQNRKAIAGLAVGLGKTLTAITAIRELINNKEIKRAIVVAPSSVKFNWKKEIENFSNMKACVLESSTLNSVNKAKLAWEEAEKAQVIIVNYEMLRKATITKKLKKLAPNCVVGDEAHKLKNNTQQTKGFTETWKDAKYMWFLTATPFPNGQPKETYNILHHLRPDKVGTWAKDFGRRFVEWESDGYGSKAVALKNLDKLQAEMHDVAFIRTHNSSDVNSKLPKERHTTYNLEMTKEQYKMYQTIQNNILSEIKSMENAGIKASAPMILAKMKRLEQVAIDPDMLQTDSSKINMSKLYPKEEWAVNTITEHLKDSANRGMVLFCDMKLPLEKIRQGLIDQKVEASKIAFITGDVKPAERTKVQDKMKTGEIQVVLCTNAAEEGVNLQHGAHTLIHLDVPWVPKSITQREGRVLRQGQPSDHANFLTPIITNTVEDTKRSKLGIKVSVIEELLGKGSAGSAQGNVEQDLSAERLSLSDIRAILGA